MERIDPKIQPVPAAGTDPGYIPGLMAPRTAEEADDTVPEEAPQDAAEQEAGSPAVEEPGAAEPAAARPAAGEAGDDVPPAAGAAEEGPVFEVSDRRSSMSADRSGVRLQLDGEEAEFRWDEIGAVEVGSPRFGRRFAVTVHTTDRHSYEADVEAPARSSLKEWEAGLDAVLDAYFEEA